MNGAGPECQFQYEFEVTWGDCDPAGIVFYPCYFRWFDAGSHRLMSAAGFGQDVLAAKAGILGAALVSASCDFRQPVSYGTKLLHRISVQEWRDRSFVISHTLLVREAIAAQGTETRVCLESTMLTASTGRCRCRRNSVPQWNGLSGSLLTAGGRRSAVP